MTKAADKYLETDPWKVAEESFHPDRSRVSESLFSLANEHRGVRGYFEEGYSGDTLLGSYVNGVYEEHFLKEPLSYRGISDRVCFLVNTVDWLYVRLELDGELLDLKTARHRGFRRELDLRTGVLSRSFIWQTASGKELSVSFSRFLSMSTGDLGAQRVRLAALNFSGNVSVTFGLDFSPLHEGYRENFWTCPRAEASAGGGRILGISRNTKQAVFAGFEILADGVPGRLLKQEKFVGVRYDLVLSAGEATALDRLCIVSSPRQPGASAEAAWAHGCDAVQALGGVTYQSALEATVDYWRSVWETRDIVIDGDSAAQQGIRFCIFQLEQTSRGALPGTNIGAKGLSGEAYNGNAFWDSEVYCLPYYLFTNPKAARELLRFRSKTLSQAVARARDLDCAGACFPVATIDGTESCTLWQHANLQVQPTTAVSYAIEHYGTVTRDVEWVQGEGADLLVHICRFLASRGQWSSAGRGFGYYGVMGPDEFHMMVNNNAYTNFMARASFRHTLRVLADLERTRPARWKELTATFSLSREETDEWKRMADAMIVPQDEPSGVYEQHDGFFDLPHMDIRSIPNEQFPLYHSWSYDRIYRFDMIKQPDVLMFLFLYSSSFTRECKLANYLYYEPRCIHESSLSPSVHSILAAELGRTAEAFALFQFATRVDLDNYNRNTAEGLHMTSIAGAWMNIVYGFGGLRSDAEELSFSPTIPESWKAYRFRLTYRGSILEVSVDQNGARLCLVQGKPVRVLVNGEPLLVQKVSG